MEIPFCLLFAEAWNSGLISWYSTMNCWINAKDSWNLEERSKRGMHGTHTLCHHQSEFCGTLITWLPFLVIWPICWSFYAPLNFLVDHQKGAVTVSYWLQSGMSVKRWTLSGTLYWTLQQCALRPSAFPLRCTHFMPISIERLLKKRSNLTWSMISLLRCLWTVKLVSCEMWHFSLRFQCSQLPIPGCWGMAQCLGRRRIL